MNDFDDKNDDVKRKSRNLSEKKRRDQFNILVTELGTMVSPNNRKMDKTTVLKTTISFLQQHNQSSLKSQIHEIQDNWKPSFLSNEEYIHLMLEALEGFILIVGVDGSVIFASENITAMLGYLARDLTNMCIFDLIEEGDKGTFYNFLANPTTSLLNQEPVDLNINVHMKKASYKSRKNNNNNNNSSSNGLNMNSSSTPTPAAASSSTGMLDQQQHPSESQYELVKLCGHFRRWQSSSSQQQQQHGGGGGGGGQDGGGSGGAFDPYGSDDESISTQSEYSRMSTHDAEKTVFICTVHLQTAKLIREIPLQQPGKTEFTSRYSLEWKFLFLDHRAPAIIGYLPFELLGETISTVWV